MIHQSRRFVLALLAILITAAATSRTAAAIDARKSYAAGRVALELDGTVLGWIKSAEGGGAVGEVVTLTNGGSAASKKHVGNVKYEEITLTVPAHLPTALSGWVSDTLAGTFKRHGGAILTLDYEGRIVERLEFFQALMTEVVFPTLDAASKESAEIIVKLRPEWTRLLPGTGSVKFETAKAQKGVIESGFRLELDGLPTMRVHRIEALAVRVKVAQAAVGAGRDFSVEPIGLEIPNLVISLARTDAAAYEKWIEDFLVKGKNSDDQERSGRLELLSLNGEAVFTLVFDHLGIIRLGRRVESNSEAIPRVTAEMYCERLEPARQER